jgi:hypothetical protein
LKGIKAFRFGVENRQEIFKFVHNSLFDRILQKPDEEVLFLESFLSAIENEKDPRNLKVIFDTVSLIAKQHESGFNNDYIEEFFETIFCYFPVTFRSNPSDPTLISVDELKASLKAAISKNAQFGDLAVPLLIEKLSLNSNAAKIDSLDVLIDASSVYDVKSFSQFRYQLEIVLFAEITGNIDDKIQSKSLQLVRLMSFCFSETDEAENWMSKFLKEALMAVKLESTAIMSKSAVLIEAISASCEKGFKFALEFCLNELLQIANNSSVSMKEQAARNCLVALLSPVKNSPNWLVHLQSFSMALDSFFNAPCPDSFAIYLVIFSFVSSVISKSSSEDFISRFMESHCDVLLSPELKNCVWLASKSCPEVFIPYIENLNNSQMLCALSSTPDLTMRSLKRLADLNLISSCDEVIMKAPDLSSIISDESLLNQLISLSLDSNSIVKLVSKCPESIQISFMKSKQNVISQMIVGSLPSVIIACDKIILESFDDLEPSCVSSLFNKCPELWMHRIRDISAKSPEKLLFALKGLLYRMDPVSLDLLKENIDSFSSQLIVQVFKKDSWVLNSKETFHAYRSLHTQWLLSFLIPLCVENVRNGSNLNCLTLLITTVADSPPSVLKYFSNILPSLVLNFLKSSNGESIDLAFKCEAWKILLSLMDGSGSELEIEHLLNLALAHFSLKFEASSELRYLSLKLLSKLVENSFYRRRCTSEMQERVLLALKSGPIEDPKRAVRQEAAKARNLWFILNEGILDD